MSIDMRHSCNLVQTVKKAWTFIILCSLQLLLKSKTIANTLRTPNTYSGVIFLPSKNWCGEHNTCSAVTIATSVTRHVFAYYTEKHVRKTTPCIPVFISDVSGVNNMHKHGTLTPRHLHSPSFTRPSLTLTCPVTYTHTPRHSHAPSLTRPVTQMPRHLHSPSFTRPSLTRPVTHMPRHLHGPSLTRLVTYTARHSHATSLTRHWLPRAPANLWC